MLEIGDTDLIDQVLERARAFRESERRVNARHDELTAGHGSQAKPPVVAGPAADAAAAQRRQARITAIFAAPDLEGRYGLARYLGFETDVAAADCLMLIETAPREGPLECLSGPELLSRAGAALADAAEVKRTLELLSRS